MKHEIAIAGMTCQSCVGRVTKALQDVPQVSHVTVSLSPPVAMLDVTETVGLKTLRTAVQSVGEYDVNLAKPQSGAAASWLKTYYPLLLIVSFLIGGTVLLTFRRVASGEMTVMSDFMGLFFVTFAFFKLLDVRGFAKAFRSYDMIAEQSRAYGLAYPFIELTLGIAYLANSQFVSYIGNWFPTVVNFTTLVLMLLGTLGVISALKSSRKIQCACLGTVFNLPMSKVTLIENLSMALMAMLMLLRLVV